MKLAQREGMEARTARSYTRRASCERKQDFSQNPMKIKIGKQGTDHNSKLDTGAQVIVNHLSVFHQFEL